MDSKAYLPSNEKLTIVQEGDEDMLWKIEEERRIRESISSSYTDRFKVMMRLMRIGNMLSRAKIIHKKMG